jgi:hypothetical protein
MVPPTSHQLDDWRACVTERRSDRSVRHQRQSDRPVQAPPSADIRCSLASGRTLCVAHLDDGSLAGCAGRSRLRGGLFGVRPVGYAVRDGGSGPWPVSHHGASPATVPGTITRKTALPTAAVVVRIGVSPRCPVWIWAGGRLRYPQAGQQREKGLLGVGAGGGFVRRAGDQQGSSMTALRMRWARTVTGWAMMTPSAIARSSPAVMRPRP